MTNLAKHEDIKSKVLPASKMSFLLRVSQPLGSNSLLLEIHDEMELSKILWLGYCTSKGINEVFVIMASSIQQGNDVLDFHMNRYLV